MTKTCSKSPYICVFILSKKQHNWFSKNFHNSGTAGRRMLPDPSLNHIFNGLSIGVQHTLWLQWTDFGLKCLLEAYSEFWYIQNPRHIKNPSIFRTLAYSGHCQTSTMEWFVKNSYPTHFLIYCKTELSSLPELEKQKETSLKKLLIFQEMELSRSRLKKLLMLQERTCNNWKIKIKTNHISFQT